MKKLIKKLEKSYKQIEGRTQSVAVSLNTEELDLIIQSLTQEPSAVSAEEIELAESIIKKRYPFYDSNIDGKDIEINGKIAVELMQEYAQQTNAEAMREHAIDKEKMFDFISWLKRGMWTNLEHRADGNITQTQLWYNTHRFDACENPKSLTDLYTEYLNTLTTK